MKFDVATYVAKCVTCSRVKAQHQKLYGGLEPLPVPMAKWDGITMDFITRFPRDKKGHDMIWGVVDRLTKSEFHSQTRNLVYGEVGRSLRKKYC